MEKKFFKFEAEGQEFVMFLRLTFLGLSTLEKFKIKLEQIIQTVKGQEKYGNIFFQFFQVQHFKGTMKFQIRTISWG